MLVYQMKEQVFIFLCTKFLDSSSGSTDNWVLQLEWRHQLFYFSTSLSLFIRRFWRYASWKRLPQDWIVVLWEIVDFLEDVQKISHVWRSFSRHTSSNSFAKERKRCRKVENSVPPSIQAKVSQLSLELETRDFVHIKMKTCSFIWHQQTV